jgi:N-acylneuraminate cytidylyltransferase
MNKIISIIPARGGSKGIPGKNIVPICGKPLIAWNIEAALNSELIDRVVVSTDEPSIAMVAKMCGAEVINRPEHLSNDNASSESALIHTIETLKQTENYEPDLVVFMQCTSPLTTYEDIDRAIQQLLDERADSAFTVTVFHYYVWESKEGRAVGVNHDKSFRHRRQDREPQFLENGAVYVLRTDGFIKAGHRFFGKTIMSVMPAERSLEIDDIVDLQIAETLLRRQNRSHAIKSMPSNIEAVVFDFDGVMTDNKVYVKEDGRETVMCDRSDGWGISQLLKIGIPVFVLSSEKNRVVRARCQKLNIGCLDSLGGHKSKHLAEWALKEKIDLKNVIYVGNDENDWDCFKTAGFGVATVDASPCIKDIASLILESKGGHGAVREVCDLIIAQKKCKEI